jgi:hypothetical protein
MKWPPQSGVSGARAPPKSLRPGLLVAKRDRLDRAVLHAGAIEAAVVARGDRVVSADGTADGGDPVARMMRQFLERLREVRAGG